MTRYEVLRNFNVGDPSMPHRLIKGNIETLPSDDVSQEKLDKILALKNPVLKVWMTPEEFKDKNARQR